MNNKVNIFEELNKMKNLIHAKAGVVISEQDGPIETIRKNLASISISDANEQAVVDTIINNYKTKEAFEDFLYRYKQNTGDDFAKKVGGTISPSDKQQWDSLVNHLSKMGITLKWDSAYGQAFIEGATPKLLPSSGTPVLQFDPSKGGFVQNSQYFKGFQPKAAETPAPASGAASGAAADTNKPAPAPGPTPTQRFATTATSLGIQNPKMDVATLQTILNTLNQGGSGLTESKNSVNEELNKMKYIFGYQRGRVISEQDAAQTQQAQPAATQPAATQQAATQQAATKQATPKDLIRQIQTVLKTKYNANLGKFGAKGDGIDEKWGNLTQTALENAMKSIADVKQRRETETQQTTTQDTAIQQAAETGRMEIPQTNNLPNLPGIQLGNQQKQDIYTTLVNNKTLLTRNQNTVIYNGPDLSSAQRNELEQSMSQKGYRISKDNRDFRSGDKIIFKKN